jgi:formamidopyrimidine-DNA glycosylase
MPELPDITLYLEQLTPRILGQQLLRLVFRSPFILRSVEPPPSAYEGKRVIGLQRLGKRIVFQCEDELFIVIHLMIAGRLRWKPPGAKSGGKLVLATLEFPHGSLQLTEAGSKRRASIHLCRVRTTSSV